MVRTLVEGRTVASIAVWETWATEGLRAEEKRGGETELLEQCASACGTALPHVWDREFPGTPSVGAAAGSSVRGCLAGWRNRLLAQMSAPT